MGKMMIVYKSHLRWLNKASQQQEDAANQNQAFTTQLQNQFGQQYQAATSTQNYLSNQLKTVMQNAQSGNGYTQPEMAALNTNNIENQANATQQADQATNRTIAQQGGGGGTTSGASAQLASQNAQASAVAGANANRNLQVSNAQQAQSNLFNSANALSGVGSQQSSLAQGVGSAAVSNANNSYNEETQAYMPSNFFTNLAQGAVSGLTGAVGKSLFSSGGSSSNGGILSGNSGTDYSLGGSPDMGDDSSLMVL